ncbi:MAG: tetratricopeptide repeat protein, partial [Rhodothermales bacterium]
MAVHFSTLYRVPLAVVVFLACSLWNCGGRGLPDPDSDTYLETISLFYAGLAAVETGADQVGEDKLLQVTELAPQEPAAWANLGLIALRRNTYDVAALRLEKARSLAPENSEIQLLSGLMEYNQGSTGEAEAYFRRAIDLDSTNVKARFALAELMEQQGGDG